MKKGKRGKAILKWKKSVESLVYAINEFYFMVSLDDFNGRDFFSDDLYTIKEMFDNFQHSMWYLDSEEKSIFQNLIDEINAVSNKYIDDYQKIYEQSLIGDADRIIEMAENGPIVWNKEKFLKTNSLKLLYDYCLKVVHLITSLGLINSDETNIADNKKNYAIPDFKQLLTFAQDEEKEKFEDFILSAIREKKGKAVAFIVCAMVELKLVHCTNRTEIYNSIRKSFECEIGTDSGINKFIDSNLKEGLFKVKDDYKAEYELTITKVQKFLESEKIAKVV